MSRWQWILKLVTRRLWFKAALYGLAAIAAALAAVFISPWVPDTFADLISIDAVESLLNVLASSMLAVATFSLGTMVAAFASASSAATPRVSSLLVEDPMSQNVLSTFIGAFIFSLVGLIALSTGAYGSGGRFLLFVFTVIVIAAVIGTFFRWIDYLSNLGRLNETLEKVEWKATETMRERCQNPYLSGSALESKPTSAIAHHSEKLGYVQHLDMEVLQNLAENAAGSVWVGRIPGTFAEPTRPLFWTSWTPDQEEKEALEKAFLIGNTRSFDQDPRFGIVVLAEIASRALSPGINDPGTAIDVIGRLVRVLSLRASTTVDDDIPLFPRVFVPALLASDLFNDAFGPISRDGAGTLEVGIRLQKALAVLSRINPHDFAEPAKYHSDIALKLSVSALELQEQREILHRLATDFPTTALHI